MISLFIYYLWVGFTDRHHGEYLPSVSLAWQLAKIAHKYQQTQREWDARH